HSNLLNRFIKKIQPKIRLSRRRKKNGSPMITVPCRANRKINIQSWLRVIKTRLNIHHLKMKPAAFGSPFLMLTIQRIDMKPLKPFDIPLSGINLIEASAGTGKTYNITSIYIRTLIEKPVTVDQILVMTFTKAATKELKDRLLKRMRESILALKTGKSEKDTFVEKLLQSVQHRAQAIAALTKAVRSFDEAAIFTIHGFCQQVLQQYAFESGAQYNAELIEDESELTQELIDDYWRRWVADCSGDISKLALLRLMTAKGFNPAKLAKEIGNISRFVDKK